MVNIIELKNFRETYNAHITLNRYWFINKFYVDSMEFSRINLILHWIDIYVQHICIILPLV